MRARPHCKRFLSAVRDCRGDVRPFMYNFFLWPTRNRKRRIVNDRIRQPRQDRSQETMTRILDAFEGLIRSRPYAQLMINNIAREATTGAGSIYARFRDKRSILLAVQDRLRNRARD